MGSGLPKYQFPITNYPLPNRSLSSENTSFFVWGVDLAVPVKQHHPQKEQDKLLPLKLAIVEMRAPIVRLRKSRVSTFLPPSY